jgi:hypothetical protein
MIYLTTLILVQIKNHSENEKEKPQNGSKYLQNILNTRIWCPEYIKIAATE